MGNEILYILPRPRFFSQQDGMGGHVTHVHGIVRALSERGYRLTILADEPHPAIQQGDSRLVLLPCRSERALSRLRWGWKLTQLGCDLSKPRRFAFCYIRYSVGHLPFYPLLKCCLRGVPLVLEVNSIASQDFPGMRALSLAKWLEQRALLAADLVITVTDSCRDAIVEEADSRLAARVLVLPNATDVDRFQNVVAASRSPDALRVGYVGTLKPQYGIESLLEAFALLRNRHDNLSLHFYGAGSFRDQLEELARAEPAVQVHGAVPFAEVPSILKSLDVFVYTESRRRGYGSATRVFEAMAAGSAIVAPRIQHMEQILQHGESALLYEVEDAHSLAAQIGLLLEDSELRRKLGERAAQEAAAKHDWTSRVDRLLAELRRRALL